MTNQTMSDFEARIYENIHSKVFCDQLDAGLDPGDAADRADEVIRLFEGIEDVTFGAEEPDLLDTDL